MFYIDDTLIKNACKIQLEKDVQTTIQVFQDCGFRINWKKSSLVTSQRIIFLGFIIDSVDFSFTLTDQKRQDIFDIVNKVISKPKKLVTIRFLGKIIGKLVSTFPANPTGPLHYRVLECHKILMLRKNKFKWSKKIPVTNEFVKELKWWSNNIFSPDLKHSLAVKEHDIEMFCDSSGFVWGSVANGVVAQSYFSEQEARLSINSKELLAIFYGLRSHRERLKGHSVLIHSDNTTAVSCIMKKGVSDKYRDGITHKIFDVALKEDIMISICHLVGVLNTAADRVSRCQQKHHTEWCLLDNCMPIIKSHCKFQMNIDLFASHLNNKFKTYCSWSPDPFAFHVNCFNLNWSKFNAYAFPPFSLILRVTKKVEEDRVRNFRIIVPWWPQSTWFLSLVKQMSDMPLFLPKRTKLFIPWNKSLEHPLHTKMKLIFIHLSASCFIEECFWKKM